MLRRLLPLTLGLPLVTFAAPELRDAVRAKVEAEYPSLDAYYKDLHAHPELSLMEENTAAKLAGELRAAGFTVTEKVGGHGVVAVLQNGAGPTLLVRADMDALPVEEETGVPYASRTRVKDLSGREVPVMHACGHDIHVTCLIGAARSLSYLKSQWSGTLVLIGQPAEERVVGARSMLIDGLFTKFPRPDFAISLHDDDQLPAGAIGFTEGYAAANSDTVEIAVRGIGGHGAYPHTTKDPVVLAARIILALQTIVSRETDPTDPCVVTVGSIHGGTKANIISNEVKLQLTLRSYSPKVRAHTVEAIRRICRGEAISAGVPETLAPIVTLVENEGAPSLFNDPALTRRLRNVASDWFGADAIHAVSPQMGAEDFSEYGRTVHKIPICQFTVGAVNPARFAEAKSKGEQLPSAHSSRFAPDPEPTIKTGVTALTAAALDLLAKP